VVLFAGGGSVGWSTERSVVDHSMLSLSSMPVRCELSGRRVYSSWASPSLPCVVGVGFAMDRTSIGDVGRGAIVAGSSARAGPAMITSSNPLMKDAEQLRIVVAAARCKVRVLLQVLIRFTGAGSGHRCLILVPFRRARKLTVQPGRERLMECA